ncbi:TetR-like C-terminal domain-containing protein [Paeniglutamicibacter sp. MACA_103]|uniref:TetR-like C-terminal domain-containing protein n=1 Tax=Paeniglutamicibacter sp. MACA_103 TaxID=3377337 RepID=UPI003895D3F4
MNAPDHRSRPRRRGELLVTAILQATIEELDAHGYAALSMDSVAARASASKASIYRRWDSKAAMVMDAVYRHTPEPGDLPDTGTLREDLMALLRLSALALGGPAGAALRGLIAESLPRAGQLREIRMHSRGRNRQLMAEVLNRAAERGEISPEAIVDSRLEVGAALLRNHVLLQDRELDDHLLAEIVDDVLLPLFATAPHRA